MRAPLGLLLATLVLSGCAATSNSSAQPAASAGTAATASSAGNASPSASARSVAPEPTISLPSGLPKTGTPEPPTDDFNLVDARGQVQVSGQCVNLVTATMTWTLIGPQTAGLQDGQQAKVTGVPAPGRETQCVGSPLLIQTVG